MLGWIIDAHGNGTRKEDRADQQPLFYLSTGLPVFEVWFWDAVARLWFVMVADSARVAPLGAVGFHPLHTREQVLQMREQWRAYRARGGGEPGLASRH